MRCLCSICKDVPIVFAPMLSRRWSGQLCKRITRTYMSRWCILANKVQIFTNKPIFDDSVIALDLFGVVSWASTLPAGISGDCALAIACEIFLPARTPTHWGGVLLTERSAIVTNYSATTETGLLEWLYTHKCMYIHEYVYSWPQSGLNQPLQTSFLRHDPELITKVSL